MPLLEGILCQRLLFLCSSRLTVMGNWYSARAALKHSSNNDWQERVDTNPSSLSSWIILKCVFHIGSSRLQLQLSSVVTCLITYFLLVAFLTPFHFRCFLGSICKLKLIAQQAGAFLPQTWQTFGWLVGWVGHFKKGEGRGCDARG